MAIQFDCPACHVAIRVPDTAAGKKGTCPGCGTKLLVPQVAPPSQSPHDAPPVPSPSPSAGSADWSPLASESIPPPDAPPAVEPSSDFVPPFAEPPQTSIARTLRRRRPAWIRLSVPLVFGAAIIGTGWWFYAQSDRLEGDLAAERLRAMSPPVSSIERAEIDLPDEIVRSVLDDMRGRPLTLRARHWMELTVRGNERGIEIELVPGGSAEFFRIDVKSDRALRAWAVERAAELRRSWDRERQAAIQRFVEDWYRQSQDREPFDPGGYLHSLGINALVGPLGYHVQAVAAGRAWRCVHEDAEGRLYFLLPSDTRRFLLEGRRLPDGAQPFRGRYRVTVGSAGESGGPEG